MSNHNWSENVKKICETKAKPKEGCFALLAVDNSFEWISCRERFGKLFSGSFGNWPNDTNGFFFSHDEKGGDKIAAFISRTESIVGCEFSTFSHTNRYYATWIELSRFWISCSMRFSLLTILIRAGERYNPQIDNYEQALYGYDYVARTKYAVMRFLYGFTVFSSPKTCDGWVAQFEGKSVETIKKELFRPMESSIPDEIIPIMGVESLWN